MRKSLFLALSVLCDPEKSGRNLLSPLYDCGNFYHSKSDSNELKGYFWRLEAYGYGFATLWKGLKGKTAYSYQSIVDTLSAINLKKWLGTNRKIVEVGASHPVFETAHQDVLQSFANFDKNELAKSLSLSLKLNHEKVFDELYSKLMPFTRLHIPSVMAAKIMTDDVPAFSISDELPQAIHLPDDMPALSIPDGFFPQAIHLLYQSNSWSLVALNKNGQEQVLWTRRATQDRLVASLDHDQGKHFFNIEFDDKTAIIKVISTAYSLKIGGDGSSITVANGKKLGIIESSAYPLDPDTDNFDESAIEIIGASYNGAKGLLEARKGTVKIAAPTISLKDHQGFEVRKHNGKSYNFFKQQGHGIQAHRHIWLQGDIIDIPFSDLRSDAAIVLQFLTPAPQRVSTHGIFLKSAYICINHVVWEADTQTVFAGTDGSSFYQNPNDLVSNSAQAIIDYSRALASKTSSITVFDNAERDKLLAGSHTYKAYDWIINRMPTFI